jgi:hypothetical protein
MMDWRSLAQAATLGLPLTATAYLYDRTNGGALMPKRSFEHVSALMVS